MMNKKKILGIVLISGSAGIFALLLAACPPSFWLVVMISLGFLITLILTLVLMAVGFALVE